MVLQCGCDSADVIKMAELELHTVINELYEARHKWFDIGIQLQLDHSELKGIEDKYRSDPGDCFRQMFIAWKTSSSQAPKTWSTLTAILRQPSIKYEELATKIEEKHCQPLKVTTGEKRPHMTTESDMAISDKWPCLEDNNIYRLETLLQEKEEYINQQESEHQEKLKRFETRIKDKDALIQDLQEENEKLRNGTVMLKQQNCPLEMKEKQAAGKLSSLSEQLQEKTTQVQKLQRETSKKEMEIQAGEKRPRPSADSQLSTKIPCLEEGCNYEDLKKLPHANERHIKELLSTQTRRINLLEDSVNDHIQTLKEANDDLKKENAELKKQYSKLEKQVKEQSGKLQQLTTKIQSETSNTQGSKAKPHLRISEIDDNILWIRGALHDVRDDWEELGREFEVGLEFLDNVKREHSENSQECLFLIVREWLTQLVEEGDKECRMCKLIKILDSPRLNEEHQKIAQTLDDIQHRGCPTRGPNEYGRFYPFY